MAGGREVATHRDVQRPAATLVRSPMPPLPSQAGLGDCEGGAQVPLIAAIAEGLGSRPDELLAPVATWPDGLTPSSPALRRACRPARVQPLVLVWHMLYVSRAPGPELSAHPIAQRAPPRHRMPPGPERSPPF